jgi:hypothetical protein
MPVQKSQSRAMPDRNSSQAPALSEWATVAHLNGETAEVAEIAEVEEAEEIADIPELVSEPEPEFVSASAEVVTSEPESMPVSEFEPVAQGQPVPYQLPVMIDEPEAEPVAAEAPAAPVAEIPAPPVSEVEPEPVVADTPLPEFDDRREPSIEIPYSGSGLVSSGPEILQPTTSEIMPESIQIPTAPVIRTPSQPAPQPPVRCKPPFS